MCTCKRRNLVASFWAVRQHESLDSGAKAKPESRTEGLTRQRLCRIPFLFMMHDGVKWLQGSFRVLVLLSFWSARVVQEQVRRLAQWVGLPLNHRNGKRLSSEAGWTIEWKAFVDQEKR